MNAPADHKLNFFFLFRPYLAGLHTHKKKSSLAQPRDSIQQKTSDNALNCYLP